MATDAHTVEVALQQLRYVERMMQLSTGMFGAIMLNADDCPSEVIRAAEDWFAYLSEVAEEPDV